MKFLLPFVFSIFLSAPSFALDCKWGLEITDLNGKKLETKILSAGAETLRLPSSFDCEISKVKDLINDETKKAVGQTRIIECTHHHTNFSQEVDCWTFKPKFGLDTSVTQLKLRDTKSGEGRWIRLRYSKIEEKK